MRRRQYFLVVSDRLRITRGKSALSLRISRFLLILKEQLFFVHSHCGVRCSIHGDNSISEIEYNTVSIHEWCADDTVVSIEVDEVEIDFVGYAEDVDWDSRPIAYLGPTTYTSQLEGHLILQCDLLCLRGECKFGCDRVGGAARIE